MRRKTVTRMSGIHVSHRISSRMGEESNVKPTTTFLGGRNRPEAGTSCGRPRATCGNRITKKASATYGRIDEEILKFYRRISSWLGHTTSSTFFRASSSKNFFEQNRTKAQFVHSFSQDPNCEVCRRTKVARAPCSVIADDRDDRL